MKKRGQVTFFILSGLIILILTGLFLYYREATIKEPEILMPQFFPIKDYVESCVYAVAEDAVRIAGVQGGYIDIPYEMTRDRDRMLEYIPGGLIKIPYWYYQGDSYIPSLNNIESQVSEYVTENIDACLDSFQAFDPEFEISLVSYPMTRVTITEKDVDVYVDYPIKVKDRASTQETYISEFHSQLDVKLKEAYELAHNIMMRENKELFFENITLDLMAMNPAIPFSGMEFHCGKLRWYLWEIEDEITEMLTYHVPLVRIENTDYLPFAADPSVYETLQQYTVEDIYNENYPDVPTPYDAYDYNHYLWDVNNRETDLTAGFTYLPAWGLKLTARPQSNGVLTSNVGKGPGSFLSFMCINVYHFTYDVSYPVLVSVRDDDAFKGQGYLFRFAFPVIVDHNKGARTDYGNAVLENYASLFEGVCDGYGDTVYDIRAKGTDEYGMMNMDLGDVNITYDCVQFSCSLGKTTAQDGVYRLRTALPSSCGHGYIVANKEGYLEGRTQVLYDEDIDVTMRKLKKVNFTVKKHLYGTSIGEAQDLNQNEEAIISIQSREERDHLIFRQYPFESDASENSKTIDLLEENSMYYLDIILMDTLDETFIGGYRANWTVAYEDLYDSDELVFHVIERVPKPMSAEDQYNLITFLDEDSYKNILKPEFT